LKAVSAWSRLRVETGFEVTMLPFAAISTGGPAMPTQFDADFDASLGVEHQPASQAAPPGSADTDSPKALGKVELDLEGAPFLQPDEPAPPPKTPAPAKAPLVTEVAPSASKKKVSKKLLLVIGGVFLLAAGVAAYFFLIRGPSAPETASPKDADQKVVVVPSSPQLEPAPADPFIMDFPQFWVELKDNEGEIRFLNCKITVPGNSESNIMEIKAKMSVVRDSIYYYLKNKPYDFLADNKNMDLLKKDLAAIISENLLTEKINEVLLENYIIK
jgi:flagellar FliL protein